MISELAEPSCCGAEQRSSSRRPRPCAKAEQRTSSGGDTDFDLTHCRHHCPRAWVQRASRCHPCSSPIARARHRVGCRACLLGRQRSRVLSLGSNA
ncbi:hypothetical protein C8T65DRAFT_641339 [Cerioporus squamosus]|nr:hypothetical protein C8T65DRAFT_641339 [Cerioporus squamosus]